MCPINFSRHIPSIAEEFEPVDTVEIYCQIVAGFIHKDTNAALCVDLTFK